MGVCSLVSRFVAERFEEAFMDRRAWETNARRVVVSVRRRYWIGTKPESAQRLSPVLMQKAPVQKRIAEF